MTPHPPAEHQHGAVSRPLHLSPLILHDLRTFLVPGDLGRGFALKEDLNRGGLACLQSHRLSFQHRGINFRRIWKIESLKIVKPLYVSIVNVGLLPFSIGL